MFNFASSLLSPKVSRHTFLFRNIAKNTILIKYEPLAKPLQTVHQFNGFNWILLNSFPRQLLVFRLIFMSSPYHRPTLLRMPPPQTMHTLCWWTPTSNISCLQRAMCHLHRSLIQEALCPLLRQGSRWACLQLSLHLSPSCFLYCDF